jgi:hypothetical protein
MWTKVARIKRRADGKIPTPTSFGSAPQLSTSEFGAFRHGFFNSVGYTVQYLQFSLTSGKESTAYTGIS